MLSSLVSTKLAEDTPCQEVRDTQFSFYRVVSSVCSAAVLPGGIWYTFFLDLLFGWVGHAPGCSLWVAVSANPTGLTVLALGVGVCALGGYAANSQQPTTLALGSARRRVKTAVERRGAKLVISDHRLVHTVPGRYLSQFQ